MQAYLNFVDNNCQLIGNVIYNNAKSISMIADCGTCPILDIIPAYEQYGTECVNHLKGAFCFILYDANKQQLFVARDRIGEKLMYYTQLPTGIAFASELSALLPKLGYPTINAVELAQGIRYNYPLGLKQTWIDQILRLRAGECAIVDSKGLRLHTYWKRKYVSAFKGSKQEAIQEVLRLMRQSMKRCLDSANGPVAVLLSGGIDSTSLAAFTKEIQQEVHVLSAGYRGNQYIACDEREIARRFATEKGLIFHEVELDVNDFQTYLDEVIPHLDEPCFDVNCMVQYALYKKAAAMGFKYIVSGLGGDELFYSYKSYNDLVEALQLHKQFLCLYPVRKHLKEYIQFLIKHYKHIILPNYPALISESEPVAWTYHDYEKFADNATLKFQNDTICFSDLDIAYHYPECTDINSMYDFTFSTFASTLCVYMANRLTQANGVKLLLPLLDVELVEFLDSLPLEIKYTKDKPKQFQKDIMRGILPDYILYARKRGFEPPFEFIWRMCNEYKYKRMQSNHVFFNSMMADRIIDNILM